MIISQIEMNDYPAVLALFKAVKTELGKHNNDQWKWIYPNRFTHKTDIGNGAMYGLKEGGALLAVVTVDSLQNRKYEHFPWKDRSGRSACIQRLAVHPREQGRGLGKKLLHYAEQTAISQGFTSIRIEVYETNASAIALYDKNGYEHVGEVRYPMRKSAYITMEKQLNG
ncbi:GNAT family N-acetyltransferase [Paenibacillus piri]|nr:GNAT family N-acetyltransferase [Paenibacillus piri]